MAVPKVEFKKNLDCDGAVMYNNGSRTVLNRHEVDRLFHQLDNIRRELKIDVIQRKSKLDDWLVIE